LLTAAMNLPHFSIRETWPLRSKISVSVFGIRSDVHRVAVSEQIGSRARP